jgi:hypothetical protein
MLSSPFVPTLKINHLNQMNHLSRLSANWRIGSVSDIIPANNKGLALVCYSFITLHVCLTSSPILNR